jgi:hypothetical protein
MRARFIWNESAEGEGGIRLYFSYSGSAPTAGNCSTLATDFAAAWATHISPVLAANVALNEVDVLDIATDSGLSGQWTGSDAGGISGATLPWQCAMNIEFDIARRYRGGKPRCFLPPTAAAGLADDSHWSTGTISSVNTGFAAFISEIEALSVGSVGTLAHVNLSYYKGFTNITNSSGRERAVPTYRATALHDVIEGYGLKAVIGSQKRRRTSTTP